jgi:hypothetical protein
LFTFREAGKQVSPVTMSQCSLRTAAPPRLPLGIKDLLKEDSRLLLCSFCFGAFAFGLRLLLHDYLMGKDFGVLAISCGRLLEGKRIAEVKRLLKGKELLKGNC